MGKQVKLQRTLGLFEVTTAGVGIILGAGIYVLLGIASGYAGNATWMAFAVAAVVSILTGLSYAELSSVFPSDASEEVYVEKAFSRRTAEVIGMMVILTGISSGATVALGFAHYAGALIHIPLLWTAIGLIAVLSLINFIGIKQSTRLNVICTIIETLGLFLVIIIGVKFIGRIDYMEMPFGLQGVLRASALIFFAYMGFETMVKLSEETKNPTKTIPKSIILAIIISSLIYLTVAVIALSVVPWEVLSKSNAPLADVAAAALGNNVLPFVVIAVIALFSTANTVLMTLVTTSRIMYGMAVKKRFPGFFAQVHKGTRTPSKAIFVLMILTMIFTLIGKIDIIANINDVFLFLTFAVVNAANVKLRYALPYTKRPFKVPGAIGKFQILSFCGMVVSLIMMGYACLNIIQGVA